MSSPSNSNSTALIASNSNNTLSVNNSSESFGVLQNCAIKGTDALKNTVRTKAIYPDCTGCTYGPEKNMKHFASQQGHTDDGLSGNQTRDLMIDQGHNDSHDCDSICPLHLLDEQYSSTTLDKSLSKINTNVPPSASHKPKQQASMKPSRPLAPLPRDCMKRLYKDTGPPKRSVEHHVLEKSVGYSYRTLLGELLYYQNFLRRHQYITIDY